MEVSGLAAHRDGGGTAFPPGGDRCGSQSGHGSQSSGNYASRAHPHRAVGPELRNSDKQGCERIASCTPWGITSENVGGKIWHLQEDQDAFTANSHVKASRAQKDGLFDDGIVAHDDTVAGSGGSAGPEQPGKVITVERVVSIRNKASVEGTRKLKPAFKGGRL